MKNTLGASDYLLTRIGSDDMTMAQATLLQTIPRLVVLDFETTLSPTGVRPVEVAVVTVEQGRVAGELTQLINPECRIDGGSRAIHHISDRMVAREPVFGQVWERLRPMLDGAVVAAHFAQFDAGVLRNEVLRLHLAPPRIDWWCTCRFARRLWPHLASHKLGLLADHFGLCGENKHRAAEDALLAMELLKLELDHAVQQGCRCVSDVYPLARHQGKSWPF